MIYLSILLLLVYFFGLSKSYFINKKTLSVLFPDNPKILEQAGLYPAMVEYVQQHTPEQLSYNQISARDFVDGKVYLDAIFSTQMYSNPMFEINPMFELMILAQNERGFDENTAIWEELNFIANNAKYINNLKFLVTIQKALFHHSIIASSFYQNNQFLREAILQTINTLNLVFQKNFCPKISKATAMAVPALYELKIAYSLPHISLANLFSLGPRVPIKEQQPYFYGDLKDHIESKYNKVTADQLTLFMNSQVGNHENGVNAGENETLGIMLCSFKNNRETLGGVYKNVPFADFLIKFAISGYVAKAPTLSKSSKLRGMEVAKFHIAHILMIYKKLLAYERFLEEQIIPKKIDALIKDLFKNCVEVIVEIQEILSFNKKKTIFPFLKAQLNALLARINQIKPIDKPIPDIEVTMPEYIPNFNYETFYAMDTPFALRDDFWFNQTWNRKVFELMESFFASKFVYNKSDLPSFEKILDNLELSLSVILNLKYGNGKHPVNTKILLIVGYFLFVFNRPYCVEDRSQQNLVFAKLIYRIDSQKGRKIIKDGISDNNKFSGKFSNVSARDLISANDIYKLNSDLLNPVGPPK
jgi:hypothetical protein